MNTSQALEFLPTPALGRGVYCNRTLNLRGIGAIGYDMDYTLIQYRVAEWEGRAFVHAQRLLAEQGWEVEDLVFDPQAMIQGLVVDTQLGHLLKVNRFGYVKRAVHGLHDLDFSAAHKTYARSVVHYSNPRYVFMTTLFSLSESSLFAQLVDRFDQGALPMIENYHDLYWGVRKALDAAHRQGLLKAEITADPERFVVLDPDTAAALLDQREAGKKLMLITNSDWVYSARMMAYAFDRYMPQGQTWRDLFDLIIVSARKPDFFSSRHTLLKVVSDDGLLRPVDGEMERGGAYFGGNAALIEGSLGLSGDQILYVGDHFFGDVHVTKTVLRWRTALVVQELEEELQAMAGFALQEQQLEGLMGKKERLEQDSRRLRLLLQRQRHGRAELAKGVQADLEKELASLRQALDDLDERIRPMAKASADLGNAAWGPLMRAGKDKSFMARLIERHADIYTSRVSNFLYTTPFAYFASARGSLPHDADVAGPDALGAGN